MKLIKIVSKRYSVTNRVEHYLVVIGSRQRHIQLWNQIQYERAEEPVWIVEFALWSAFYSGIGETIAEFEAQ